MSLVRSSLVAVVATALAATMLGAAPASAGPARERDGHFPVQIDTTVPAGGSSLVTTPPLTRQTKKLTVTVTPQDGATAAEEETFDQLTHVMGQLSKGKKLLVCIMLHNLILHGGNAENDVQYNVQYSSLALLMLGACLRMAGLIGQGGGDPARPGAPVLRATGASCGKESHSVPATVVKTDTGYQLSVDGTTSRTKKPKLRVSCRAGDGKFVYRIRATKKGTSLRKIVGKKLGVGIQSPGDASTGVPVTVRFATP